MFRREVYKYAYSLDGSLTGYVNNSLSYFNIKDFSEMALPRDPFKNLPYNKSYCRSVNNLADRPRSRIFTLRLLRLINSFIAKKEKDLFQRKKEEHLFNPVTAPFLCEADRSPLVSPMIEIRLKCKDYRVNY